MRANAFSADLSFADKLQEDSHQHSSTGKFVPVFCKTYDGRPVALEAKTSRAAAPEVKEKASASANGGANSKLKSEKDQMVFILLLISRLMGPIRREIGSSQLL